MNDKAMSKRAQHNDIAPEFLIPQIAVVHVMAIVSTTPTDLYPREHRTPVV